MDQAAAVRLAIDIVQVPSRIRNARTEPLPDGMETLLRIAAGEPEATRLLAEQTGRPPALLHQAATFFVEQILMAPGTDSYRVLGAAPDASPVALRRNMALLVSWLHPDVADDDPRSVFAQRVNRAWEDLKTPARRKDYDSSLEAGAAALPAETGQEPPRSQSGGHRQPATRPRSESRGAAPGRPRTMWQRLIGRTP